MTFWNVRSVSQSEGVIDITGEIADRNYDPNSDALYITPKGFDEALKAVEGKKKITVKINSPGGDLFVGMGIYHKLKELKAHKTIIINGLAGSAATLIACAGDVVCAYPNSLFMIHGVSTIIFGAVDRPYIEKLKRSLDACEASIAKIYAQKTGLSSEQLRKLMDTETWFLGDQIVKAGFADEMLEPDVEDEEDEEEEEEILNEGENEGEEDEDGEDEEDEEEEEEILNEGEEEEEEDEDGEDEDEDEEDEEEQLAARGPVYRFKSGKLYINGVRMTNLPAIPKRIRAKLAKKNPAKRVKKAKKADKTARMIKTVAQLRKAYPRLVNKIVQNAVSKERRRIMEIEDISNGVRDKNFIYTAKFETGLSAKDVALEALRDNVSGKSALLELMSAEGIRTRKITPAVNKGTFDDNAPKSAANAAIRAFDVLKKEGR